MIEIAQSYDNKIAALERAIEKLRAKKAMILSSIQEDIGDQEPVPPQTALKTIQQSPDEQPLQTEKKMNMHDRLVLALDKMPTSGFKTSELFMAVSNDGLGGEINKNRASKVFRTLIDEGIVEVSQHRHGTQGGVYRKIVKGVQSSISIRMIKAKPLVSAIKRINEALEGMEGEFNSTALWSKASNDGRGPEIPKTSFHPKFSQMLKDGLVVIVKKQAGGIAGIYTKADKKPVESSPAGQEKKMF